MSQTNPNSTRPEMYNFVESLQIAGEQLTAVRNLSAGQLVDVGFKELDVRFRKMSSNLRYSESAHGNQVRRTLSTMVKVMRSKAVTKRSTKTQSSLVSFVSCGRR